MVDQPAPVRSGDPGFTLPAYRWIATLFAVLIIGQAYLGTRGFFADQGLIDIHAILANSMFLIIIVQTVLAWMLYTKTLVSMTAVGLNVLLVLLTVAQIGLGYSTRDADTFANTISLHIPNGVLLMGVSAAIATMAWRIGANRMRTPVA